MSQDCAERQITITAADEAAIPEYVAKWERPMREHKALDMSAARRAIDGIYRECGLALVPPERTFFAGGPLSALRAARLLDEGKGNQIRIGSDGMIDGSALGDPCLTVEEAAAYGPYVQAMCWGQDSSAWLAFYDWFIDRFGDPELAAALEPFFLAANTVGWWSPFEDAWLVQERRQVFKHDEQNRLHCHYGPAVAYADGLEWHYLEGKAVSKTVAEQPEKVTLEEIRGEQDQELRAQLIARWAGLTETGPDGPAADPAKGWGRYLRESGAAEIERRTNPVNGAMEILYQVNMGSGNARNRGGDGTQSVMVVSCPSTRRVFALSAPSEVRTCEDMQKFLAAGGSTPVTNVVAMT